MAGSCECGTKPSGFIKFVEFLEKGLCSMELDSLMDNRKIAEPKSKTLRKL